MPLGAFNAVFNLRPPAPRSLSFARGCFASGASVVASALSAAAYAAVLPFGVVGSPIDLSANVKDVLQPGGTVVFQDSSALFGTTPSPVQSAELLHFSDGINPSSHSKLSGAFTSSLAQSDGNGGVGVSQLIFGSPDGAGGSGVRQLVAQSLWTQTFVYNGTPTVDISLHLQIPELQVELWGIPPNRDFPSATETASAIAQVDTVITHADGTFSKGGSFQFGLREFETQIPNTGGGFINFANVDLIGAPQTIFDQDLFATLHEDFDITGSRHRWRIDPVSTSVDLGKLRTGDTLAYVYTLTAVGTTHAFERGYDAFLGDPFGVDTVTGNLGVTVSLAGVPEPSAYAVMLLGFGGIGAWLRSGRRARCASPR